MADTPRPLDHRALDHRAILPALAIVTLALCGCSVNPSNTRLPELAPQNPSVERARSQVHDPFPLGSLGPETGFRPREFSEPRQEPLRLIEQQLATQSARPLPPPVFSPSQPSSLTAPIPSAGVVPGAQPAPGGQPVNLARPQPSPYYTEPPTAVPQQGNTYPNAVRQQ